MADIINIRLRIVDGVVYASSRDVAEDFGKDHRNVLRDIQRIRSDLRSDLSAGWFRSGVYYGRDNTRRPCIDMTRQGWILVAMNYQGMVDWKAAYIQKFDEMEGKLGPQGARTETLFDRSKRDNVVAFQGPSPAQSDLFSDPPSSDANARHLEALIGERRLASTWAGDVEDEPEPPNPLIGERSPPAAWGRPLVKMKAHHVRRSDGRSVMCQCLLSEDNKLVEFHIRSEPMRPTAMRERILLMNTPQEFLCRFEYISGIDSHELLNHELECSKSPLTDQQAEAVLTLLTSGVGS